MKVRQWAVFLAFLCGLAVWQRLNRTRWVETRAR